MERQKDRETERRRDGGMERPRAEATFSLHHSFPPSLPPFRSPSLSLSRNCNGVAACRSSQPGWLCNAS